MKRAYFLVLPNLHMLDLAGPLQIIATVAELGIAPVTVQCIGPQSRLQSFQNATITNIAALPLRLEEGDALFVIGSKLDTALMDSPAWAQAVEWLRQQAENLPPNVPICGICTGSFLLGEAGLLDGKTCTGHHQFIDSMRSKFPHANVVENRVWCCDNAIWTSAGVSAGIDLTLQLIVKVYGTAAAINVARENVVDFRRFSNDPELCEQLRYRHHGNQLIHNVQDALESSFSSGISCQKMADDFGLSYRQLARLFHAQTGISMKRYQLNLRMEMALNMIQTTDTALEEIALRCGFSSIQAFRSNWNKLELPVPSVLRKTRTPNTVQFQESSSAAESNRAEQDAWYLYGLDGVNNRLQVRK